MNLSNIIWNAIAFIFVGVAEMLIAVMHVVMFMVSVVWVVAVGVFKGMFRVIR